MNEPQSDPDVDMAIWTVQQSSDGHQWKDVAAFHGSMLALAIFDCELNVVKRYPFIRLVSPDGIEEERAKVEVAE